MINPITQDLSLYLHVPFCQTKCPYCDFNTYEKIEQLIPNYIASISTDIQFWGATLNHPVTKTIFLGGGTPSYIPNQSLAEVIQSIRSNFQVSENAEITIESNPGDLNSKKLENYLQIGINRLSIGIQSFDDELLTKIGRRHNSEDAISSYKQAINSGFSNISMDLMFGLPGQTKDHWLNTLNKALELNPTHISLYCLTLEPGTPMESWERNGKIKVPDNDMTADMYSETQSLMLQANYKHYEISNWCKDGYESIHNLTYWQNEPYIGIGPGAHSYLHPLRFWAIKSPREYIKKTSNLPENLTTKDFFSHTLNPEELKDFSTIEETEYISTNMEIIDTVMMGIRLNSGLNFEKFKNRFGISFEEIFGNITTELIDFGLVTKDAYNLKLTDRGRMLCSQVTSKFLETLPTDTN